MPIPQPYRIQYTGSDPQLRTIVFQIDEMLQTLFQQVGSIASLSASSSVSSSGSTSSSPPSTGTIWWWPTVPQSSGAAQPLTQLMTNGIIAPVVIPQALGGQYLRVPGSVLLPVVYLNTFTVTGSTTYSGSAKIDYTLFWYSLGTPASASLLVPVTQYTGGLTQSWSVSASSSSSSGTIAVTVPVAHTLLTTSGTTSTLSTAISLVGNSANLSGIFSSTSPVGWDIPCSTFAPGVSWLALSGSSSFSGSGLTVNIQGLPLWSTLSQLATLRQLGASTQHWVPGWGRVTALSLLTMNPLPISSISAVIAATGWLFEVLP